MDEDMYDDTASSIWSSSYSYSNNSESPPNSPFKAPPVLNYDIRYAESASGGTAGKCIDLVFILDCTGSMQRYINSVRDHIAGICEMIRGEEGLGGLDDLRVAIVNYRDHRPQDTTYVYQFHPFTADIADIQDYLKGLTAAGGGDGPEAVTAAMAASLTELNWRRDAARMAVLIADAPPHGIGEGGDQIKGGDPDGHDPLVIARTMAQNGITLFMVACEETLSGYHHAVDFFQALCNMTSGLMLPLTTADLLAMTIVGSVLENMDMERLISEIGSEVAKRIKEKGETMQSVEEVALELHERLLLRNEQTKQVQLPEVYVPNDIARQNVTAWMSAQFIADAVPKIKDVPGKRLTDTFRRTNAKGPFKYVPGGRLPPRRVSVAGAPPTPSSPEASSPPSFAASSPGRRVVSDFKAFGSGGSPQKMSVFGAPLLPVGPAGGMFGSFATTPTSNASSAMRGGRGDEDDDDEEEGTRLRKDNISLDQARRIATQSVFRAGRL
ncbi:hypothetical protein P7C73_g4754, partial [Tremellales sp. Uapishka_1]